MIANFEAAWRAVFGSTPPLGYRLRAEHPKLWTRFHALPGSKRYADSDAERRIILNRANRLGAACFPATEPIWLVRRSTEKPEIRASRQAGILSLDGEDGGFVVATPVCWQPGTFDALFSDIAEERQRALLFSPAHARVLAPYDGGFDIFDRDPAWLAALERRHADWMSAREDRL